MSHAFEQKLSIKVIVQTQEVIFFWALTLTNFKSTTIPCKLSPKSVYPYK